MATKTGTCKLTGLTGTFIRAHLLPRALTKPAIEGAYFIQAGKGTRPSRRWNSWYDDELVTRKGEDILAELDTWAIRVLREKKLVWSGWGAMNNLGALHEPIGGDSWGIRHVPEIDAKRLRLFFLSLLWRAAATKRFEFSEISIDASRLEVLRETIAKGISRSASFYPISLTQLSTRGVIHNYAPRAMTKTIPATDTSTAFEIPIFRFFFDGLIAHIHDDHPRNHNPGDPTLVGMSDGLTVSTIPFVKSAQYINIRECIDEFEQSAR